MSWDGIQIKNLRRRMGWSQTDLGRRLHCSSDKIHSWESGNLNPESHHERVLELLSRHLEPTSDEMRSHALADCVLDKDQLTQVTREEIEGRLPPSRDK